MAPLAELCFVQSFIHSSSVNNFSHRQHLRLSCDANSATPFGQYSTLRRKPQLYSYDSTKCRLIMPPRVCIFKILKSFLYSWLHNAVPYMHGSNEGQSMMSPGVCRVAHLLCFVPLGTFYCCLWCVCALRFDSTGRLDKGQLIMSPTAYMTLRSSCAFLQ